MNYGVYGSNSGRVVNAELKVVIADITLTNPGSFEGIEIPAGFTMLEITGVVRSTVAAAADNMYLIINDDYTATNYSVQFLNAFSTTVSTSRSDTPTCNVIAGATAATNDYTPMYFKIPNINSPYIKNGFGQGGERQSSTVQVFRMTNWQWENTAQIKKLTFRTDNHPTDLFATGSRLKVFGLGTFAVALAR